MRKVEQEVADCFDAQFFEFLLVDRPYPGYLLDGSLKIHMVRSRGFEPLLEAPQAPVLSIELRALILLFYTIKLGRLPYPNIKNYDIMEA